MKKDEVKIDGTYLAKVSGGVVPVRITGEKWTGDKHVGWVGVNTQTNRSVRIKSAQRLRAEVAGGAADAQNAAAAPDAGGGAASPAADAPAKGAAAGGKRGGKAGAKGRGGLRAQAKADQENARMRDERQASPDGMTAGERAMATSAAPATTGKAAKTAKEPKPAKPKRTSALDAAAVVLAEAGAPMKPKEMVALMEARGLWTSPGGKTPEATLYAAIIREIAAKKKQARFRKTERGTFIATGVAGSAAGKEA